MELYIAQKIISIWLFPKKYSLKYYTALNFNEVIIFQQNFWQFSSKILYSLGIAFTIVEISEAVSKDAG